MKLKDLVVVVETSFVRANHRHEAEFFEFFIAQRFRQRVLFIHEFFELSDDEVDDLLYRGEGRNAKLKERMKGN